MDIKLTTEMLRNLYNECVNIQSDLNDAFQEGSNKNAGETFRNNWSYIQSLLNQKKIELYNELLKFEHEEEDFIED